MPHTPDRPRSRRSNWAKRSKKASSLEREDTPASRRSLMARLIGLAFLAGVAGSLLVWFAYDRWYHPDRSLDVARTADNSDPGNDAPSAPDTAAPIVGATGERAEDEALQEEVSISDDVAPLSTPASPPQEDAPPGDLSSPPESSSPSNSGFNDALTALGSAILRPTSRSTASGRVFFQQTEDGALRISAEIEGAPPGDHGLHILESNRCTGADGRILEQAHFNPFNTQHGAPNSRAAHLGDLGNITVSGDGSGILELFLEDAYYPVENRGGWSLILGKVVALTRAADDGFTQPDGNSGPIIACGLIARPST